MKESLDHANLQKLPHISHFPLHQGMLDLQTVGSIFPPRIIKSDLSLIRSRVHRIIKSYVISPPLAHSLLCRAAPRGSLARKVRRAKSLSLLARRVARQIPSKLARPIFAQSSIRNSLFTPRAISIRRNLGLSRPERSAALQKTPANLAAAKNHNFQGPWNCQSPRGNDDYAGAIARRRRERIMSWTGRLHGKHLRAPRSAEPLICSRGEPADL